MQEYLYHAVAILIEVLLEIIHLPVSLFKKLFLRFIEHSIGYVITLPYILSLNGDKVLVMASVENGYLASAWNILMYPPQVIVSKLVSCGSLIIMHLYSLRIDTTENVLYYRILSGSVKSLYHHNKALSCVRVELVLKNCKLTLVIFVLFDDLILVRIVLLTVCWELTDIGLFAFTDQIFVCLQFIYLHSVRAGNGCLSINVSAALRSSCCRPAPSTELPVLRQGECVFPALREHFHR